MKSDWLTDTKDISKVFLLKKKSICILKLTCLCVYKVKSRNTESATNVCFLAVRI